MATVSKVEGETRRRRKGKERGKNQERSRKQNSFLLEDDSEEIYFNPFQPSSPNSKKEGNTRRRRKGNERGANPVRSRQQNSFLLEDDSDKIHFNPFLHSPNSSSSSLYGSQIRTEVSKARWVEEIGMAEVIEKVNLGNERTEVSKARWVEEIGMAEVIEKKGSMWVTTGVIRNSKLYCHIEEIGYLAEIGALVLFDEGDNVMGLRDIYTKCANRKYGCSWESFKAYRHLKSLGYIVGRHDQPWSLKHNKINPNSGSTADTDLLAGRIEELQIDAANLIFDIHRPNSKFKKTDPGNPSFIIFLVGDRPPSRKEVGLEKKCKSVPLKFCHVSHDNVSFFSFPKVSLPVLP
ncbi:hypothetical protein LUZ61_010375 [Rhynchospora tenuis]|uniref:tRNA-splicing endonuclease subunit Sen54 N-terminal domain-containing protein n=1 Tax=Rhynchospora tenuis TaxID=198213 RepID=A0AAD5ZZ47_9POAL|nr:hypothetical protein LUZ61_010375 [Rhynchospora tenuis]